jgi:hypothetical protein
MLRMHGNRAWVWGLALVIAMTAGAAWGQQGEGEGGGDPYLDPTMAPLIVPAADEFAPAPDAAADKSLTGAGVGGYFEVTGDQKAGLLTPSYRFSPAFVLKARVPLIFERTLQYWAEEASAGGLGDVVLDAEYARPLSAPGSVVRLQLSAKLPTGDEEKMDGVYAVPLGTGTLDLIGRAQYARSTPTHGLLASLLYRKNTPNETITDLGGGDTRTFEVTGADQIVATVFGRKLVGAKWWLNLGLGATLLGDGKSKTTWSDGTPGTESDLGMGGTLVDLYPGVGYALGSLSPFLGLRVPVVTDYDNEFADDERDVAVVFQFSWRPTRLVEGE